MKKFLIGLLIIFCLGGVTVCAHAEVYTSQISSAQSSYIPSEKYLKFYRIDKNGINMYFIDLSGKYNKKFIKAMTDYEKEDYKYVEKIQKSISRGNWSEVLIKYPDFFPAYVQYYRQCMETNNYKEALRILIKIRTMDRYSRIFRKDIVDYELGSLYYNTSDFSDALQFFKIYENTGKDDIYSSIANCYFYLGDYQKAVEYKHKMKNPAYIDKELIYSAYIKMNDIPSAHSAAKELLKDKYGFINLMRLESTSPDDNTKLSYAYSARNAAATDNQIVEVDIIIAELEQKKLDKRLSTVRSFIKAPKWYDIRKQFPANVTPYEMSSKQDEFFTTANSYLDRYKGQDLTNAFNSLNQDFVNYIQSKQALYRQQKEIEQQAEILAEQQRQYNYMRAQIRRQQQLRYYMDMDRMYYMNSPAYYMMPPAMWW